MLLEGAVASKRSCLALSLILIFEQMLYAQRVLSFQPLYFVCTKLPFFDLLKKLAKMVLIQSLANPRLFSSSCYDDFTFIVSAITIRIPR